MPKFWKKVLKCKHENLNPNYCQFVGCGTPYCSGWEVHCLDCGAYISECGLGFMNGVSGWPYKRHIMEDRKKRNLRRKRNGV